MGLGKHWQVAREAWGEESRRRRAEAHRQRVETAFLPAALEVMDTPPRPAGRVVLWLIVAAAFTAIAWACLSHVDVVAVAEGRLVPEGKLQSVEAAESGVVTGILVTEGQRVTAGEPLVTLDPTYAEADTVSARNELAAARLQRARALVMLAHADEEATPDPFEGLAPTGALLAERRLAATRIAELTSRLAGLAARAEGAEQARAQAGTQIARIEATLPAARQQLTAREALVADGYASALSVAELRERVTNLTFDLTAQTQEVQKAAAELRMLTEEAGQAREAFRAEAAQALAEAEAIIATRSELLAKAERRSQLQTLTAPVDGTVNEVALTTIGQLAEPGQPLLTIVPAGNDLYVHTFLLNRDRGFVSVGDEGVIKLEAYPFTRHGFLRGEVDVISSDSVVDEARGLVYPARVRIVGNDVRANGREAPLTAGMAATVEVTTGRRRVIDYVLSPVARATSEAGRER